MTNEIRDLFDHWELVWHEAQYDLIPICVGANYARHDEAGDRTVTREAYTAEQGYPQRAARYPCRGVRPLILR
jgi:hypothetical protein